MKTTTALLSLIAILFIASCGSSPKIDTYQLKVFTLDSTMQDSKLENYLETAYLPALHRAGIEQVGVFKTIEGRNDGQQLIVVFIPFKSISELEHLTTTLGADTEYEMKSKEYFESPHDMPPYLRMESTILKAFSSYPLFHAPDLATAKSDRVYELRSYLSATELLHKRKVEMFNSGESELFVELGFQPMFFGEVVSGANMPNLMYMTCHADETTQTENWKAFGQHPKWNEMKVLEKYQNTVSHIDKWMLYPTDYSDF